MNIVVLSASRHKNCTLKDVAGGFRHGFHRRQFPFAKLLEIAKRIAAFQCHPGISGLHLAAEGAGVRVLNVRGRDQLEPADLYLSHRPLSIAHLSGRSATRPNAGSGAG